LSTPKSSAASFTAYITPTSIGSREPPVGTDAVPADGRVLRGLPVGRPRSLASTPAGRPDVSVVSVGAPRGSAVASARADATDLASFVLEHPLSATRNIAAKKAPRRRRLRMR
jgi:hypothetical protein